MSDEEIFSMVELMEKTAVSLTTLHERISSMRALIDNIDARLLELEMTYTQLAGREKR